MPKKLLLVLSTLSIFALVGCTNKANPSSPTDSSSSESETTEEESEDYGSDYDYNESITIEDPADIEVEETDKEFSLTTEDGTFTNEGNIYTITAAGTYAAKGRLEGQIIVEATKNDEVVLELNGVTIINDSDSPIKAVKCDKLEISAKKGSGNTIIDNRAAKTVDDETVGEGAINAKCDLKLKGAGTLLVEGNYNNGIHTTKDLTIQKETVKITGYNNAVKAKDSFTLTSGEVHLYAKNGNGIKTENTDISSKGNQRGTIAINGGTLYVNSLHDALDASYNIEVNEADPEVATKVSILAGTKSEFYSRDTFVADSEKGFKAQNNIIIDKGTIVIDVSDDGIHANYGAALDNEETGQGNITINDGLIKVNCGDDGLHSDNTLAINGGKVVVASATEGFEGNYINIAGGYSYIYGSDDGVNASKKSFDTCGFTMTGGYLDVAVRNGDTDGIDSNGYVTISGGTIVTRGSPGTRTNRMSTGLDVDGTCSMTGGTLIAFNGLEKKPTTDSNIMYAGTSNANSSQGGGPGGPGGPGWAVDAQNYTFNAGNYTLTGDGLDISFTNDYNYASFMIYSANLVNNGTYTLSLNGSTLLSWTQSSSSVTI